MDWTKEKYTAEEVEEESAFLVAHSLSRGLLPPCLLLLPSFNQRKGIASCNYTDTPQKGNKAPTNQHLSCSQTLIRVKYSKLLCKSKWPIKNRQWRSILNLFPTWGNSNWYLCLGRWNWDKKLIQQINTLDISYTTCQLHRVIGRPLLCQYLIDLSR